MQHRLSGRDFGDGDTLDHIVKVPATIVGFLLGFVLMAAAYDFAAALASVSLVQQPSFVSPRLQPTLMEARLTAPAVGAQEFDAHKDI